MFPNSWETLVVDEIVQVITLKTTTILQYLGLIKSMMASVPIIFHMTKTCSVSGNNAAK